MRIEKKTIKARYEFGEAGVPRLSEIVDAFLEQLAHAGDRR